MAQIKNNVAVWDDTFKLADVKKLHSEEAAKVTTNNWNSGVRRCWGGRRIQERQRFQCPHGVYHHQAGWLRHLLEKRFVRRRTPREILISSPKRNVAECSLPYFPYNTCLKILHVADYLQVQTEEIFAFPDRAIRQDRAVFSKWKSLLLRIYAWFNFIYQLKKQVFLNEQTTNFLCSD